MVGVATISEEVNTSAGDERKMDDALGDADEENDCITAEEDTEYRKQIVTN